MGAASSFAGVEHLGKWQARVLWRASLKPRGPPRIRPVELLAQGSRDLCVNAQVTKGDPCVRTQKAQCNLKKIIIIKGVFLFAQLLPVSSAASALCARSPGGVSRGGWGAEFDTWQLRMLIFTCLRSVGSQIYFFFLKKKPHILFLTSDCLKSTTVQRGLDCSMRVERYSNSSFNSMLTMMSRAKVYGFNKRKTVTVLSHCH